MVEEVGGNELEVEANTLIDLDVLCHSHIHVPIPEAPDLPDTASTLIQAQDRISSRGEDGCWVRKHVELPSTANLVECGAVRGLLREDALLVGEEVAAICRAEGLGVGIGVAVDRSTATIGEHRCNRPPAQEVPSHTALRFVVRVINQRIDVVDELPIEVLHAIHIVKVEGIVRSVFAGGLNESPRAEGLAVCKVLLQGDIVPIGHLERNEGAVVIPVANAGIDANATGELAVAPEC